MADYRAQRLARIRADYERFTAHSNPMTDNNLIPPPELVQQWLELSPALAIAAAFQAGADQELEACCEWLLEEPLCASNTHKKLRATRRKPPSLKEQALQVLEDANLDSAHYNILLRALEALPND